MIATLSIAGLFFGMLVFSRPGGDFWDKLRSLLIREARVVFPSK